MKKIFVFSLFAALYYFTVAQNWKITLGNESKSLQYKNNEVVNNGNFIGFHGDDFLFIGRNVERKKTTPIMVYFNRNLENNRQIELPIEDDNHRCYGGFASDESVDLLMTEKTSSSYKVMHYSYNPVTLASIGEPQEMASFAISSKVNPYTFVRESQSDEWIGLFHAMVSDGDAEWRIVLCDTKFDEMWNMEFHAGVMDDFIVTDSGEVVTAGYGRLKNSKETRLEFCILDGESEHKYGSDVTIDELMTLEIVRYADGKVYCTGLLPGEQQDDVGKWASGFYSLVYDTRSDRMTHFEKILFTRDDICDLCNVSRRNKLKVLSTDKLSFASSRYDKDGATVVYERSFNLYVNGGFVYTNYVGMLAYRLGNDGKILWNKVIRRDIQAPSGIQNGVRTRMIGSDGNYTIFYMDHDANVNPSKPDAVVKQLSIDSGKPVFMALGIDRQGNITRQGLAIPPKSVPIGTPHLMPDGRYLVLFSQPFKSFTAILDK